MIKKVRNRFILVGTAAASAVTILLVLAINIFNTIQINSNLDDVLYEMSQEKSVGFDSEKSGALEVEEQVHRTSSGKKAMEKKVAGIPFRLSMRDIFIILSWMRTERLP